MTSTECRDDTGTDPARADAPGPGRVARVLVLALGGYKKWISPLLPPACRFHPSCSVYAAEAVVVHGAVRGSWLALRRFLRCGPWHPGGYDPVPPRTVVTPPAEDETGVAELAARREQRARDPGRTVLPRDRTPMTPAEE